MIGARYALVHVELMAGNCKGRHGVIGVPCYFLVKVADKLLVSGALCDISHVARRLT